MDIDLMGDTDTGGLMPDPSVQDLATQVPATQSNQSQPPNNEAMAADLLPKTEMAGAGTAANEVPLVLPDAAPNNNKFMIAAVVFALAVAAAFFVMPKEQPQTQSTEPTANAVAATQNDAATSVAKEPPKETNQTVVATPTEAAPAKEKEQEEPVKTPKVESKADKERKAKERKEREKKAKEKAAKEKAEKEKAAKEKAAKEKAEKEKSDDTPKAKGKFVINSKPWSKVTINGKTKNTPFKGELPVGKYSVKLKDSSGRTKSTRITIKEGATKRYCYNFETESSC